MNLYYSLGMYQDDVDEMVLAIKKLRPKPKLIYGIPQGGTVLAMDLSHRTGIPIGGQWNDKEKLLMIPHTVPRDPRYILIVDDILDSGRTRARFSKDSPFFCLHERETAIMRKVWTANIVKQGTWVHYWWETKPEQVSGADIVTRCLQRIGEDPLREGLVETPNRVVKSWKDLYGGYSQDPASVFKVFEDGACDEMVLLKNIEFYSTCEHHMLPFFGRAHIAYIPNGRVVGISKLARLLEVFARRLQIQERLGQQITGAIVDHLKPKGAACILEAQHFCMTSRGVQKQDSIMVTSSLTGAFKDKPEARAELLTLVKG